jgi:DNA-directed RNA polymerase subunit RPC12/RpoP
MSESFQCSSCGAPLDYTSGMGATTRCPYCNHSVIVPKELRDKEQTPVYGQTPSMVFQVQPTVEYSTAVTGASNAMKWIFGIVGVVVVLSILATVVLPLVIGAAVVSQVAPMADSIKSEFNPGAISATINSAANPSKAVNTNALNQQVMEFGSEGNGPGRFSDARSIALDGAGNIYVGEYSGGRVQVFDSSGKFTTQWIADPKMPMRDLAADLKGTVYVVQKGDINLFEGSTGKSIGKLTPAKRTSFDKITIAPDGSIYAAGDMDNNPVIVVFKGGKQTRLIQNAFGELEFGSRLGPLAVDGSGNIFLTVDLEKVIIKVSPDGKYVNRFGGKGNEPGLFQIIGAIAIDGNGKIFVNNIDGVEMFDSNGRFVDTYIKKPGGLFGFVFDDKDLLFGADRTRVVVFEPKK